MIIFELGMAYNLNLTDMRRHRQVYSQIYHNNSLNESPIMPEQEDSEEADLYIIPTTYQANHQKIPRHLNLKVSVINLLEQLKSWLI